MKRRNEILALVGTLLFFSGGPVIAQDLADDEADVWATIESEWRAAEKGDSDRLEDALTDDFTAWSTDAPAPRTKSSTIMWDRFFDGHSRSLRHELYPLAIVVHGDVAIAHYLYTEVNQDKGEDGIDIDNGRFTDVLVRTPDGWKFLAWHGGNDD